MLLFANGFLANSFNTVFSLPTLAVANEGSSLRISNAISVHKKKVDLIIVKGWTKDRYAVTSIDKEVVVLFNLSDCIILIAIVRYNIELMVNLVKTIIYASCPIKIF